MPIRFFIEKISNRSWYYVVTLCKDRRWNCPANRENFQSHFIREFSHCSDVASFSHHVLRVFVGCAKKKMVWANTWWIVTVMEHAKSFWNFCVMYQPTHSVNVNRFEWMFSLRPSRRNRAVPLFREVASPDPARSKFGAVFWNWPVFVNLAPKTCEDSFGKSLRNETVECIRSLHTTVLSFLLVCRTPGCFIQPRGISFFTP